ncbi:Zinc finger, PHD-type domain containing protein [Trema orientale]|uniref:Zinc finger, PHD-type domain containing protein n=1 Tax=Trema orientale TaxID=63057 RepID=A0A2P5BI53_TREOI|nr:Zinc finger, PHD-type domain containing protein [Trema orientale]
MKTYERKRKSKINKETEAEDWCFECKDGGELLICDYGDCLKVYHPDCVGKDESCLETGERWICGRHSCLMCSKTAKFQCFCCPNAVCAKCISSADFVHVRGENGFCSECLELILLGEQDEAYDADGVRIDFGDRETFEGLFKEYWEIIKQKEGLTMDDIHDANTKLKKNENQRQGRVSKKFGGRQEDVDFIIVESDNGEEKPKPLGKSKRSKKQEFIGWGSKSLIEFLKSIGKDTTKQVSQCEVDSIIKEYIQERNLLHPENKHKVLCDERLYSLFRKKSFGKKKIYFLLEAHFVENLDESESNEYIDVDAQDLCNKGENIIMACKKQRIVSSDKKNIQEEEVDDIVKLSCFASIVPDNVKLVYLRKSLVEELFKQSENFEEKVVGSFIRVKTDPRDYLQKNSHQLLPVTGVKRSSVGEITLKVSSIIEGLRICMLSDSDFTEEECQDLKEKIERGELEKLTIVELEEKAKSLHEDITKHAFLMLPDPTCIAEELKRPRKVDALVLVV